VFFVGKKDGKKRMVQDYRYLNEWTIKNNYPLPLISDVLENIGTKKFFMKMDLRWGYNNVRIKERDEWKAAFMTPGSHPLQVVVTVQSASLYHTVNNWYLSHILASSGCLRL